jgi:hypothetical protein
MVQGSLEFVTSEVDAKTVEQVTKFCIMVDRVVGTKNREVSLQDVMASACASSASSSDPKIDVQPLDRTRMVRKIQAFGSQIQSRQG